MTYETEDKIDAVMESFYAEVLEATAKGRQVAKKTAGKKLMELGMSDETAKVKVQRWFEAIREQQKQ